MLTLLHGTQSRAGLSITTISKLSRKPLLQCRNTKSNPHRRKGYLLQGLADLGIRREGEVHALGVYHLKALERRETVGVNGYVTT